jgi:hypothetical protein
VSGIANFSRISLAFCRRLTFEYLTRYIIPVTMRVVVLLLVNYDDG